MPQASRTVEVNVLPAQLMQVISDYERYPQFLPEVKKITVSERTANSALLTYEIEVIKRIHYAVRVTTDALVARWSLVRGELFKKNEGAWVLEPLEGGRTKATYSLELAFGGFIPVPRAITDRLAAQSLPALLEHFKARAESLFPRMPAP